LNWRRRGRADSKLLGGGETRVNIPRKSAESGRNPPGNHHAVGFALDHPKTEND